jgi:hypothetical protein
MANVELMSAQETLLPGYVAFFDRLFGGQRTRRTFAEVLKGIISAGSLVCQRIAQGSPLLSRVRDGGQRVSRLARGESTKRSQIDAEALTAVLRERGIEHLAEGENEELWLVADGSELRKPYAREMPDLMRVRDLDGSLVWGYRTMNVVGITPSRRAILYHRLFSAKEADFTSESLEVQRALQEVHAAVEARRPRWRTTWILDSAFDDVAVWRTLWEQDEHVVCRLKHRERRVAWQDAQGQWVEGELQGALATLPKVAKAQTEMVVRRERQPRAKRQAVPVEIRAGAIRLTYESNVRREGYGETIQRTLWLVEAHLLGTAWEPWLLLTDWPVTDAESAVRIFSMYRQRWAVEDSFHFLKDILGWEDVQLLDLEGVRTLLALGWVAAGFLYELGVSLEWEEVQLLARLGGWIARPNTRPGKIILTRGLRRLLDLLVTQAVLDQYRAEHGALPPRLAAFLSSPEHHL